VAGERPDILVNNAGTAPGIIELEDLCVEASWCSRSPDRADT
jgi:hypothetical protein